MDYCDIVVDRGRTFSGIWVGIFNNRLGCTMNELMYKLLAEARDQPVDVVKRAPHGSCILTPAQLEKYTQLVVQECANLSKQHFGVKE